jgi:hypothetical protein
VQKKSKPAPAQDTSPKKKRKSAAEGGESPTPKKNKTPTVVGGTPRTVVRGSVGHKRKREELDIQGE